jgi:hypothetical protein
MKRERELLICLGVIIAASVAAAADYDASGPGGGEAEVLPGDGSTWLSWDNGTPSGTNQTLSGWVGHEFDVSTLGNYTHVNRFRMYMRAWPNRSWDGGQIGICAFSGGVPGSILWGPEFVVPNKEGWNNFNADCFLGSRTKFLAFWDRYYNSSDGDTLCFDTGPAQAGVWQYYGGAWAPSTAVNANLMLRVRVDDENNPAVAPASIGRVKALYH